MATHVDKKRVENCPSPHDFTNVPAPLLAMADGSRKSGTLTEISAADANPDFAYGTLFVLK